jgi:predicted nucleotidyltransferase
MSSSASDLLSKVRSRRGPIQAAVRRHNGLDVRVFGSVARGEASIGSDVDFLVRFAPGSSLFDVLRLQDELSKILQRPVDVISEGALNEWDNHIFRECVDV